MTNDNNNTHSGTHYELLNEHLENQDHIFASANMNHDAGVELSIENLRDNHEEAADHNANVNDYPRNVAAADERGIINTEEEFRQAYAEMLLASNVTDPSKIPDIHSDPTYPIDDDQMAAYKDRLCVAIRNTKDIVDDAKRCEVRRVGELDQKKVSSKL
ncbi:hypothetical protein QBC34DRAFT_384065 [Podospora aff. communis PSN243]|uniref:Uncharacterized protein n=1 Tax=Podospora aff. communis PSN243 TaxID=3040156 RepID=A0AAV9GB77_9PEZI|nr:hypothetical protein QBC34DRAFT_384065 [Podospora aff. communis PSN243]